MEGWISGAWNSECQKFRSRDAEGRRMPGNTQAEPSWSDWSGLEEGCGPGGVR